MMCDVTVICALQHKVCVQQHQAHQAYDRLMRGWAGRVAVGGLLRSVDVADSWAGCAGRVSNAWHVVCMSWVAVEVCAGVVLGVL